MLKSKIKKGRSVQMKFSRVYCLLVTLTLPLIPCVACHSQQKNAPTKSAGSNDYVIAGEHFVKHTINDTQLGNIPAATINLPSTWSLQPKLVWNFAWTENPIAFSLEADNPANAEAYFVYPMLKLESFQVPPNMRQYIKNPPKPGQRLGLGAIYLEPMQPLPALALFVKQVRGSATNFKWVAKADLPDLAKALNLDPQPGQHGGAIKISYDLNGKPVEEAFYGVYYISQGSNTGVGAGTIKQTNWGLQALQSFRAPAGTLDKRMTIFAAISKSVSPIPAWTARAKAVDQQLVAIFNQKLKQGYDQIRAAQALADQVTKNMGEFEKGVNSQMAANRASGDDSSGDGSGGSKRSVQDKWDDLYRGVDTVNDPSNGGTSQHSYMEQYHWTDGFGNYYNTNDPNDDPNGRKPGSWTLMTTAP